MSVQNAMCGVNPGVQEGTVGGQAHARVVSGPPGSSPGYTARGHTAHTHSGSDNIKQKHRFHWGLVATRNLECSAVGV